MKVPGRAEEPPIIFEFPEGQIWLGRTRLELGDEEGAPTGEVVNEIHLHNLHRKSSHLLEG